MQWRGRHRAAGPALRRAGLARKLKRALGVWRVPAASAGRLTSGKTRIRPRIGLQVPIVRAACGGARSLPWIPAVTSTVGPDTPLSATVYGVSQRVPGNSKRVASSSALLEVRANAVPQSPASTAAAVVQVTISRRVRPELTAAPNAPKQCAIPPDLSAAYSASRQQRKPVE
jgi:hypothetical protein